MLSGIALGWLALFGRTLTLGVMHPMLKRLNEGQSALVVTALFTFFGSLASLIPAAWSLYHDPGQLAGFFSWAIYPAIGSVAFTIGMISFNRALRVGDISLLSPLTALTFIFVYILDLAIGNTSLTALAVAGIVIVSAGMYVLNLKPGISFAASLSPFAVFRQPGAVGALTFAVTLAVARVVDNEGMKSASAPVYAAVAHLMVFVLVMTAVFVRRQYPQMVSLNRLRGPLALLIAVIGLLNYLFLLSAYRWFNPSTIEPVSQLGIVLSVMIGAWYYREPLHLRWLAALLVIGGAALVVVAR